MKKHLVLAATLLLALACMAGFTDYAAAEPSVRDILTKVERSYGKLKDLRGELSVTYTNEDELTKISEDFARSLGFKKIVLSFKAPDKLRYESSNYSFAKVVAITNGDRKAVQIPSLRISKRVTVAKEDIGKKQYPIDFGIAFGDLWTDWDVNYVRTETVDGSSCYVLRLTNPLGSKKATYLEIYIDRSLWIPKRFEKIRYNGELKSRLCFKEFHLVDRVAMVPYRIEIYNRDNKLGGVLEYKKCDTNCNLPDSSFRIP